MKITQIIERTTFLRPIFISNFNYFSIESHLGGGDDKNMNVQVGRICRTRHRARSSSSVKT